MLPRALAGLAHNTAAWTVFAYLVGAIPMGVLVAWARGVDLRKVGSGNIGATNASRALGAKVGVLVLLLDAGKAAFPVLLAASPWALGQSDRWALAMVAFATVLGHIFPVYLGFRGGKGVACALGVFAALDPPVAGAALVLYVQTLWLTRTSAIGSLTAVTGMTLTLVIAGRPVPDQVLAGAIAVLIWVRHTSNIRTLIAEARARKQARSADDRT